MAGTLTISTLSDGTNSTSSTNCIQGSAKAWVNFNGNGATTIRASYNVSSVTYNAVGTYTINFTTAFADANYAASLGVDDYNTIGPMIATPPTTTSFAVGVRVPFSAAFRDVPYVYASFFR